MSAAVVAPTAAPMQGAHPAAPRTASLFVSDLPRDLPNLDDLLQSYFGKIGTVVTTKVCVDISTRKPLGYGYVNFQDAAKAEQAIKELNLTELTPKHEIRVAWSQRDPSQRRVNVNNLVVKKLGDSVTGRMLMDAFAPLGTVVSVKVSRTDTGKTRHYGFVQFESKEVAETALALSAEGKLLVGGDVVQAEWYKRRADRQKEFLETFRSVFAKNIKKGATEDEVKAIFAPFGGVEEIFMQQPDNFSTQWAVVKLATHEAAVNAIAALHDKPSPIVEGDDAKLHMCRLQSKTERQSAFKRYSPTEIVQNGGRNVYVKYLPDSITEEQLRELFAEYGAISNVKLVKDATGTFRGFAFIVFETDAAAKAAAQSKHNFLFAGRPLYVAIAQNKDARHRVMENQVRQKMQGAASTTSGFNPMMMMPPNGPMMMPGGFNRGAPGIMPSQGLRGNPMGFNPMMGGPRGPMGFAPPGPMYGAPGGMRGPMGGPRGQQMGGAPFGFFPPQMGMTHPGMMGPMMGMPPQMMMPPQMHQGGNRGPRGPAGPVDPAGPGAQGTPAQGGAPSGINAAELSKMSPEEQKNMLGERLYVKVHGIDEAQAAKITGMLLEMDTHEILNILEDEVSLRSKVNEAITVLRDFNQNQ